MLTTRIPLHAAALVGLLICGSVSAAAQSQPAPAQGQPQPAPVPGLPPAPSTTSPRIAPSMALPVAEDFVIGPEDVLGILFWREADFSGDVQVRPDGRITIALIGDLVAAGVKPSDLRDQIQEVAAKYLTDPNVTVVVRQINSRKVFITGEVGQPGAYPLTGPRTVMQLISLAGGVTQYAKSEKIAILRQEQGRMRSFNFNYKEIAQGKNVQQNILLQPGDTIVVPE